MMDIELLISRYVDGDLSSEEESEFHHLLAVSPEARGLFREHLTLHSVARDERVLHQPTEAMRGSLFSRLQAEEGMSAVAVATAVGSTGSVQSSFPIGYPPNRTNGIADPRPPIASSDDPRTEERRKRRRLIPILIPFMLCAIAGGAWFLGGFGSREASSNPEGMLAISDAPNSDLRHATGQDSTGRSVAGMEAGRARRNGHATHTETETGSGAEPPTEISSADRMIALSAGSGALRSSNSGRVEIRGEGVSHPVARSLDQSPAFVADALSEVSADATPVREDPDPPLAMVSSPSEQVNANIGAGADEAASAPVAFNIEGNSRFGEGDLNPDQQLFIANGLRRNDLQRSDDAGYDDPAVDDRTRDELALSFQNRRDGEPSDPNEANEIGTVNPLSKTLRVFDSVHGRNVPVTADNLDSIKALVMEELRLQGLEVSPVENMSAEDLQELLASQAMSNRSGIASRSAAPEGMIADNGSASGKEKQTVPSVMGNSSNSDFGAVTEEGGGAVATSNEERADYKSVSMVSDGPLDQEQGRDFFVGLEQSAGLSVFAAETAQPGFAVASISSAVGLLPEATLRFGAEYANGTHVLFAAFGAGTYGKRTYVRRITASYATGSSSVVTTTRVQEEQVYEYWGGFGYRYNIELADRWKGGAELLAGVGTSFYRVGLSLPVSYKLARSIRLEFRPGIQYRKSYGAPETVTTGSLSSGASSGSYEERIESPRNSHGVQAIAGIGLILLIR